MNVTLTPEFERLIREDVRAGRSADSSEFLKKAVYHYIVARDLGQEFTPGEIDRMIAKGLDDIERGETIDGNEAFANLRAHTAELRRNLWTSVP